MPEHAVVVPTAHLAAAPFPALVAAPPPSQAHDDAHLVRLWLHGKSANTRSAYERDVRDFIDFADRPLQALTLGHLQGWADALEAGGLKPASRARKLSAVKSLLSFGHEVGYLVYNVGAAVRPPRAKDELAERILPESALHRLLALADARADATNAPTTAARDRVLLRLFYASGGRVSELARLRWRDVAERSGRDGPTLQLTLFGKGDKTRRVLLSAETARALDGLRAAAAARGHAGGDDAVFRSRKDGAQPGGTLSRQQLWRLVKAAAARAGLPGGVSPHWLRHAHVSHALDRGAPPHLVQQTVGHASLQTTSRYAHARPDDSSARYLAV